MAQEEKKLKRLLFLLNDTDRVLLHVIKNKFKKEAGWESTIATNYDEAVLSFLSIKPDGVLTEIIIEDAQGRTGFDFIAELKEKEIEKKVQIVIFTELSQDTDKERAEALGVKNYFVKTQVTLNELIEKIQGLFI